MRISDSSPIIFKCRGRGRVGIAVETTVRAGVVSTDVFREDAAAGPALAAVGFGIEQEVLQRGIVGCKSADQFRVDAAVMFDAVFR